MSWKSHFKVAKRKKRETPGTTILFVNQFPILRHSLTDEDSWAGSSRGSVFTPQLPDRAATPDSQAGAESRAWKANTLPTLDALARRISTPIKAVGGCRASSTFLGLMTSRQFPVADSGF